MAIEFRKVDTAPLIACVAELAEKIWNEYYPAIIGQEQVDYMVDKYQNPAAISSQIDEGYEYYLVFRDNSVLAYCAVLNQENDATMFLSKIYVKKEERGKGIGGHIMDYLLDLCRRRGIQSLWLTVNKNNKLAISVYEKSGFENLGSVVQDIGQGFVMDDYKMEKKI